MILTPEHEQIHKQLGAVAPGSPEEKALLHEARALNSKVERETGEHKVDNMVNSASPEGVINSRLANQAGEIAVQQTTEEYQIPVTVAPSHIESQPAGEHKLL